MPSWRAVAATVAGYDVVTENRYFVSRDSVEWEELSFSVNGSKWGADRPAFPLLQPEKVLSLPLQLRFDEGYRYRLAGTEHVDDFDCYVVRFDPVREDSALYKGTVWIDRKTFARVRVQAVQGGLAPPVISNDETQRYAPVAVGNRPVFLFTGLTARQLVLIAGRNLMIEKSVEFTDFRVNQDEFDRERARVILDRRDVVDRLAQAFLQEPVERGLLDVDQVGEVENVLEARECLARARRSDPGGQMGMPPLRARNDFEMRTGERRRGTAKNSE